MESLWSKTPLSETPGDKPRGVSLYQYPMDWDRTFLGRKKKGNHSKSVINFRTFSIQVSASPLPSVSNGLASSAAPIPRRTGYRHTAINQHDQAGDVARFIGSKKDSGIADIPAGTFDAQR